MLRKTTLFPIILVTILAVAACAIPPALTSSKDKATPVPTLAPPTVKPMPEVKIAPELQPMADKAIDILTKALSVDPEDVTILEIEAVQWSDASLGCPEPGMMYAQMITPGYRARALVNGQEQLVHMDQTGQGVTCAPDIARAPLGNK